ncbi:threonine aldolase family protein [Sporosarcina psychrophila]|uniref:Threonine aldolase n=1 Tax=Sporosarcina psychrophila TaxID=1476 RepID=A0ABV2K400_SPOPS
MSLARVIDLRSDTVTLPKAEMIEAIRNAPLGDSIMGEDPTVNQLEKKAAELLGMEAALLVTSGTMANQITLMSLCNRGEEVIMGEDSHIYTLEGAAAAVVAQVQIRTIEVPDGIYDASKIESRIQTGDIQRPKTSLICLENTYNLNKGQIVSLENMKEIRAVANKHSIPVYLDGARLFNAAIELGVTPDVICREVDAVQFCLTKGLGCPIGSILAGTKEFIETATINRQRLGGGMRQAGIIAAPAIYALDHMIDRLSEDHKKAKLLAASLSTVDGIKIQAEDVQTNIVSPVISHEDWDSKLLIEFLSTKGIKVKNIGEKQVRMVVHYQITDEEIQFVVSAFEEFSSSVQIKTTVH